MHQKHKLRKFQELHILNADRVYQIKVIYIYISQVGCFQNSIKIVTVIGNI